MPTLKIDGKDIAVPAGTSIIEAAKKAGTFIPHYCYHPGLSVAGNCRMCLVEVEKSPKLQISCFIPVADGMVVHTENDRVKEAREAVLEFLLVNHPLDCPVCDQSGECELQNYYMNYGLYESRLFEDKVKKEKVVPIGPTVMLDGERCVLCSRCVRFCDEVTGTHEMGIVNRGDHAEITVAPGKELDNAYSGNTVDICPVGALTDRDFRFKCRVWFLEKTSSICPGCSRGCNIEIHWNKERPYQTPNERVMRLKPRVNPEVNQWWICDEGRYNYHFIDQNRVLYPMKNNGKDLVQASWQEVMEEGSWVMKELQNTAVIVSTDVTLEDLWIAKELFIHKLGIQTIAYLPTKKSGEEDHLLRKSDKTPNTKGAQALGFEAKANEIFSLAEAGKIKTLILFGHNLIDLLGKERAQKIAEKVDSMVWIGSNQHEGMNLAKWIIPSSVYAEKDGTFMNYEGRVQRIFKAFPALGESKAEWQILKEWAQHIGINLPYENSSVIFEKMVQAESAFNGMSYQKLGEEGVLLNDSKDEGRGTMDDGRKKHVL
ncbi:MAG: (2Fe-2S)-binding protein [Chlamydiae bacterium]|nr:(2Fe-2S)-binding protein [Chlamydiota bacterium]MBI3276772.1 (2Fe-2S)-binding protein [Chlamydiota bacterium]